MESTYNANRYRGQHGQIGFITGAVSPEEQKTSLPDTQSAAAYALAPVQDFQRRGDRNRSHSPPRQRNTNDIIDLDLAQYKQQPAITPYTHTQPPTSKYLSYPASSSVVLPAISSTQSADSLLPIVYELRSSLVAEQEARKHLEVQLHEIRLAQQAAFGEMKATVGAVGDEVKGGESRWLTLSARVKEMELAASLEGRYNERSDKLDAREQATQQQSVVAAITELRGQMEEREQRYRDELEATHREYSHTIAAMKEQQLDARQLQEERWQQQMDTMQQRVQLAVEKAEATSATTADVTALVNRLSAVEANSNSLDSALRQLIDATRREGEEVSSKGEWLRGVMMEQLEGRAKMVEGKIDTVEEGRRLMLAAVQKEITGMRDEMDRRLRDVQSSVVTASEHERQRGDDMEMRVQAAVKQSYGSLSNVIKDTVSALNSRVSELENTGNGDSSIVSTVQSMSESHAELESVLRAEVKTRMKSYNKTKAQLDLLNGQVTQLKQMVGTEDGEVRKVAAEVKATEAKLERMKERVREIRTKGEEEMDKERRMLEEVKRRVDGLEEMRRRVEGLEAEGSRGKRNELEEVRREVEQLKRAVAVVDRVDKSMERLQSDERERQQQLQTVVRRMDENDRWMADQMTKLNTAVEAHQQERTKQEQAQRQTTEQFIHDEFELTKRAVRDEMREQLAGYTSHADIHSVTTAVQAIRAEMEEREKRAGHRMDQLARSLRTELVTARQSVASAGQSTDEDHKEAQHLLHVALETRGVLDDMVAAVEHDHQQQALHAIRHHVNAQLQAVDDRLHRCEQHVSHVLAAKQGGTNQLPQLDRLTVGLEAVRARCEQQGLDAQLWYDDVTQQLQHVTLTMLATGDKREQAVTTKQTSSPTVVDKVELLAVRADVSAVTARVSSVEEELSKKVDYSEETNVVLQQQLTSAEVKLSRLEAEWSVIREERERQRMSISSNPPSARQAVAAPVSSSSVVGEQSWTSMVSQQLNELRAQVSALSSRQGPLSPKMGAATPRAGPVSAEMASDVSRKASLSTARLAPHVPESARQADLLTVQSELQRLQQALTLQSGELASRLNTQQQQLEAWKASVAADMQQQSRALQPSKLPQPSTANNTARPASATAINAKMSVMNVQLTDLTQQLAAQQSEQIAAKLRTEGKLTQLAADQQQLMHAVQQLRDRTRQATSQSQRGGGTARLSDSEGVVLASLSSHPSATQAEVAATSAQSSGPQVESTAASSAEISNLQQAMAALVGELSWRVDDLTSKQADITQQLTALTNTAAAPAVSVTVAEPTTTSANNTPSVRSAPATGPQPVDSASAAPHAEVLSGLSSEVELLKQQLHGQVGEMGQKMVQLQSQFDSLAASSAAKQEQHLTSTTDTAKAANASPPVPADTLATSAGYDRAALDGQLEQMKQTTAAQLSELSAHLGDMQQALRVELSHELVAVNNSQQRLQQQLGLIEEKLAAGQPLPIPSTAPTSLAPQVDAPTDMSGIAQVDSKVEQLQQAVAAQFAELSYRLNELTAKQQLQQPQAGESTVSLALPPAVQPLANPMPPLSIATDASAQPTSSPVMTSRRSSQGLASPAPLRAAIEAVQAQWQQQFQALAEDTRIRLDALQHTTQHSTTAAQIQPRDIAALESELAATSSRLSLLVGHVQRIEESAATLRSTEAAEMEDIVNRITAIYKKSKDDIASLQSTVADIRHGLDAKEVQLQRLDEHVVDDIRKLMENMVRVEGEGKGERLLMQRQLRELEHALSLLSSKVSGRPVQLAGEARDVKSARTHVDSPRRPAGGSDGDTAGASKLSFLSPANGGRVMQHGRSVSSIEGSREPTGAEVSAGRPDSQQAVTPRHHPHISIELTTPLAQHTHHLSDAQSVDEMYDQQATPKPSDDNTGDVQPHDSSAPLPQPPAQQRVAPFHDRGLSIEVNAAPLSYIQQPVQPQSPLGPIVPTRSLNQSPKHSSPRQASISQPPQHPQHRPQQSEPNLQPLNQSPTLAGKGKPSSRAQPMVQTDRPAAREQQRSTSTSQRLVDMARVGEPRTAEVKALTQPPLMAEADLSGLSVSGSAVSAVASSAPPSMAASTVAPKRASLSGKHSRTQSTVNRAAEVYETKLQ